MLAGVLEVQGAHAGKMGRLELSRGEADAWALRGIDPASTTAGSGITPRTTCGRTLAEYAERNGVSRETARIHVKQLLAKTGAHRQSGAHGARERGAPGRRSSVRLTERTGAPRPQRSKAIGGRLRWIRAASSAWRLVRVLAKAPFSEKRAAS